MPEDKKQNLEQEGIKDEKKEPTTAELVAMIDSQKGLIEALQGDSASARTAMQDLLNQVEEKFGTQSDAMQNITNLLGTLASGDDNAGGLGDRGGVGLEDLSKDDLIKIMREQIGASKKSDDDDRKATNKKHTDDYVGTVTAMLDAENSPEGKSLSQKERNDIVSLLKTKFTDVSSNDGKVAAIQNFKKAYKNLFGLDKVNPFKGSNDMDGTGMGGGDGTPGGEKKGVKLSAATEKALSETKGLGISVDEAKRLIAKRNKRLQEVA